jgi:hypothetical protein
VGGVVSCTGGVVVPSVGLGDVVGSADGVVPDVFDASVEVGPDVGGSGVPGCDAGERVSAAASGEPSHAVRPTVRHPAATAPMNQEARLRVGRINCS